MSKNPVKSNGKVFNMRTGNITIHASPKDVYKVMWRVVKYDDFQKYTFGLPPTRTSFVSSSDDFHLPNDKKGNDPGKAVGLLLQKSNHKTRSF